MFSEWAKNRRLAKIARDKEEQEELERIEKEKEQQAEVAKHEEIMADIKERAKLRRDSILAEKQHATLKNEPWVGVLDVDVDYQNFQGGNFELDWNDLFVAKLVRAGYVGKTDAEIVDQWFTNVCRNIVLETFEQEQADKHPVKSSTLDDGRKEYR